MSYMLRVDKCELYGECGCKVTIIGGDWSDGVFFVPEKVFIEHCHQWISVKDRLPDKAMWCLVWDGLDVEKEYFYDDHFAFGDITHWMPVPKPPESEK